jgi:hypothetical protein
VIKGVGATNARRTGQEERDYCRRTDRKTQALIAKKESERFKQVEAEPRSAKVVRMTDEAPKNPLPDWNRLAQDALDLWQGHLTSLATDPSAKADLARLMQPMGQMVADWTAMMQKMGAHGQNAFTNAAANAAGPTPSSSEPAAASTNAAGVGPADEPAGDEPPLDESVDDVSSFEPDDGSDDSAIIDDDEPGLPDDSPPESTGASGDAAPAARASDMAQLADRLAELERRLDERRSIARTKRRSAS